jgi:hypothetical protein
MLEPSRDEGFAMKPRFAQRVARQELLDRNIAAEVLIVRTRHAAQTAPAVLADDPIPLGITTPPRHASTNFPARLPRELITGACRLVG